MLANPAPPALKAMISRWFRPVPQRENIASLYGAIVAQARAPAFYSAYGVSDTVNGRLEMIMLHAFLLLRRLRDESGTARRLAQGVFDAFCQDMDDNMREMGVGDLAVPRKMRRIGQAFYARQAAYDHALAEPQNDALAAVLCRNIFSWDQQGMGPQRLADYIREAVGQLERQASFEEGIVAFPDPERLLDPHAVSVTPLGEGRDGKI
jgi:cytochrome b pre-mRNA-processing protein 3